ncbi:MAG: hypothetical protein NTZ83_06125, partial [Candidatus Pacearchaeota archaeon]|nr:hypothetical protein [Candidatus Pacearchaeota archaeon]
NKIGLLFTVRDCPKKSCLYLAWSQDGENFELEKKPFIGLDKDARKATEDARITKIKREYFITFTAYKGERNGKNILRVGFVKTKNFKNYYNRQIILDSKEENKNALFFKNEKDYFIIDRPFMKDENETPGAQIALVKNLDSLEFEEFKTFLLPRENSWDNARVGINTPAIKCWHEKYGKVLFMLYHGADKETNTYKMGYIITDEKDPTKILERSKEPLIKPELDFEKGEGKYPPEIPNVIFGCGTIPIDKNTIRFYYSGADRWPSFADLKFKNMNVLSRTLNQKLIN